MKIVKEEKGISLVVLLITIIILSILAAVTVHNLNEDEGMIEVTKEAANDVDTKYNQLQSKINALQAQK